MLRPGVKYLGKRPAPTPPAVRFGDNDIERIIIGEEIPASARTVFPYDKRWITGAIGYLDFEELHDDKWGGHFTYLHSLGIEPSYRRRGYASQLFQKVEEITRERAIPKIMTSGVQVDRLSMLFLLERRGYHQYADNGVLPWREHREKYPRHLISVLFEKVIR